MSSNLPLVPSNWRSASDSVVYAPTNYAWSRPSVSSRTPPNNPGMFRDNDGSHSTNNRSPVTENQRLGRNSDVHVPSNNNWNRPPHAPRPPPYSAYEMSGATVDPWRLFEDRVRTGPYGLNGFPLHPLSPMRIIVLGNETAPEVNPRLRQFIQESPPRVRGQWNMELASDEDDSRLTREEQKKALKKLKKQIYNPYPKNKNKRWSLYYRDNAGLKGEEQDDDGKSCAICLEDFVPKQEVLVTPCNHMFHNDCIIRWVKSNGQCPVCRFALGEQRRETALPLTNNNSRLAADNLMAVDLLSLIRAMEEAFDFVQVAR